MSWPSGSRVSWTMGTASVKVWEMGGDGSMTRQGRQCGEGGDESRGGKKWVTERKRLRLKHIFQKSSRPDSDFGFYFKRDGKLPKAF